MQAYNYTMQYATGSQNAVDVLSRNPNTLQISDMETLNYVNMVITYAVPLHVSLRDIVRETNKDLTLTNDEVFENCSIPKSSIKLMTKPLQMIILILLMGN